MNDSYLGAREHGRAIAVALEIFDYEIAKNQHKIKRWRKAADLCYAAAKSADGDVATAHLSAARHYQEQIEDADRRVAVLKWRRIDEEERERCFLEAQRDIDDEFFDPLT
jgi:hypothetical protein